MIEHNETVTQFSYIDKDNNMVNITDQMPIEFCQSVHKLIGGNIIDESLINENTEDIYDYIIEKLYTRPEYMENNVEFKSKHKIKIAFNKFIFKIINKLYLLF